VSRKPWLDAIEVQAALVSGLVDPNSMLRTITLGFERSIEESGAAPIARDSRGGKWHLPDWQAGLLIEAPTYWVAAEMLDVVDHAAESIQNETMQIGDLPSPSGFALLERPIGNKDARGRWTTWRAISWTTRTASLDEDPPAVAFTFYVDARDRTDEVNQDLARQFPESFHDVSTHYPFQISHVGDVRFGHDYGSDLALHASESLAETLVDDVDDEGRHVLPAAEIHELAQRTVKWLRTFWRLMQQRIGHPRVERPDRAVARRLARSKAPVPISTEVQVITLRRYAEAQEPVGGADPSWSHRWMVGGHWRNQYYPSLDDHRQIWIAPYVKGDPSLPLVIKDRVYRWDR
jgi:hypothetical protein